MRMVYYSSLLPSALLLLLLVLIPAGGLSPLCQFDKPFPNDTNGNHLVLANPYTKRTLNVHVLYLADDTFSRTIDNTNPLSLVSPGPTGCTTEIEGANCWNVYFQKASSFTRSWIKTGAVRVSQKGIAEEYEFVWKSGGIGMGKSKYLRPTEMKVCFNSDGDNFW